MIDAPLILLVDKSTGNNMTRRKITNILQELAYPILIYIFRVHARVTIYIVKENITEIIKTFKGIT